MKTPAIDVLLALAVAACWLGAAGFLRLRGALDRLHCVTFVNIAAGAALTIAAFVADGASDRALKTLLCLAIAAFGGAALAHATGRALRLRRRAP